MIHNNLVIQDNRGIWNPLLAAEQISVENGTWRLNADGTMDTVWTLRPNVFWHDGTPFTSADMLLTFNVYVDPTAANPATVRPFLRGASAPDPHTFVMHWSTIRFDADSSGVVITGPMPKHKVGELFARGDRLAFENDLQFTSEFVGLGAYRLVSWQRGSHMEFAPFEQYFQGPPPLDGIILKFMGDPNSMVSHILAGAVDLVLPLGVDLDAAAEVRRRWEGTGNQVKFDVSSRLVHLELQNRPEYALPRNGFTDSTVRQAFLHAIDRTTLAEVTTGGIAPPADSWIMQTDALYPELEASIPRFPYDPSRAQQLLAQAGWSRTSGTLTSQSAGEPFRIELLGSPGEAASPEKSLSVIAQNWTDLGVLTDLSIVPGTRLNDREYRSQHPGVFLTTGASQRFAINALHSQQITSPATRWGGFNRGGYNNPRVDAVLDKLTTTIAPSERIPLHRQLLQEQLGDVAFMPLYWEVVPILLAKGVSGPSFYRQNASWNVMQWKKE